MVLDTQLDEQPFSLRSESRNRETTICGKQMQFLAVLILQPSHGSFRRSAHDCYLDRCLSLHMPVFLNIKPVIEAEVTSF